ncbi:MAG TPA: hypothetical protein VM537_36575 [Anaerolineae bacterium]|nr:hypothetical protein [Anaerolineae bacterium]
MTFPMDPIMRHPKARHFVIRTIRNGKVRIFGHDFTPDAPHIPYDGRLDGLRYAFGLYEYCGDRHSGYHHFAHCWGTEAAYRSDSDLAPAGPEVVDGALAWEFWSTAEQREYDRQRRGAA